MTAAAATGRRSSCPRALESYPWNLPPAPAASTIAASGARRTASILNFGMEPPEVENGRFQPWLTIGMCKCLTRGILVLIYPVDRLGRAEASGGNRRVGGNSPHRTARSGTEKQLGSGTCGPESWWPP